LIQKRKEYRIKKPKEHKRTESKNDNSETVYDDNIKETKEEKYINDKKKTPIKEIDEDLVTKKKKNL